MSYRKDAQSVIDIEIEGLEFAKNNIAENFDEIVNLVLKCSGRLVITGMGKSGLVGKKIAATLASTGTRSFFMHPGEAYHGDLGMISSEDIIIAISNSGETEEVIKLLSFFKDNGNKIIAMTAKNNSTLANYSDFFIDLSIPKEACPLALAPTTSTTVTMALGDALAVSLMNAREFKAENFARFHPGGSLGRKLLIKVKDVMRKEKLPTLGLDDSFESIISVIGSGLLGMAVVLDDKAEVCGIITDGDLRRGLQEFKDDILNIKAKDILTKSPKTIDGHEKIVVAEEMMNDLKITALVVKEENKLLGILHLYDL